MKILVTGEGGELGSAILNYEILNGVDSNNVELIGYNNKNDSIVYDYIIHTAGRHPNYTNKQIIESNVTYLQDVIKFSSTNVKNFMFISSVSVYGDLNKADISEKDETKPKDMYSFSKLYGELILENQDFNVLCLRVPGFLGLKQSRSAISKIYQLLLKNDDVLLDHGGVKFNSFVNIDDLTKFILSNPMFKKYDIINYATDSSLSLYDITCLIKNKLSSKSNITQSAPVYKHSYLVSKLFDIYKFRSFDCDFAINQWLKKLDNSHS